MIALVKKMSVITGSVLVMLILLGTVGFVLYRQGLAPGLIPLMMVGLFYGWMLFAYLHYRQGRQDELLHLLTTAVEAQVPLAPALWTYLYDRPQSAEREVLIAILLFFVVPGYYWVWHRRHSFDRKVANVARQLDRGVPLDRALRASPGVASRDTVLAATIGQATGRLALCLRNAAAGRLATLWLQLAARVLYPLLLLCFMLVITGFWMNYVLYRITRIFSDFGEPMPALTLRLVDAWELLEEYYWVAPLVFLAAAAFVLLLVFSSTLRWYVPGIGRLYRTFARGRALKMLGVLLDTGKTAPEALSILANSGYFARTVRRGLRKARGRVERGEPLGDSLCRGGLLPAALVPLVQAAEQIQNLPWTLIELGETLVNRAIRHFQRISMAISPILVAAVGLMVAFIVLAMFSPLTDLLARMSE